MSGVFAALLRVHLGCAAAATVAFWLAACAPKGGPFHRAAGRWFSRLIYAAAATGGVIACAQLAAPTVVRPPDPGMPSDVVLASVRLMRQMMWFVLYALLIIVTPVQHGLAVVRAGSQPMRVRSREHAALSLLSMLGSALILSAAVSWQQWMFLVVAPIGFIVGLRNLAYATRPFAMPGEWQREHLTSMITAGITLHTVMLVFTTSRTLGMTLHGWTALAPWTVPVLLGLPAILLLRSRWRGRIFPASGRGPTA